MLGGQEQGAAVPGRVVDQRPGAGEVEVVVPEGVAADRADLIAPRVGLAAGDVHVARAGLLSGTAPRPERSVAVHDGADLQVDRAATPLGHGQLQDQPLRADERGPECPPGGVVGGVRAADEVPIRSVEKKLGPRWKLEGGQADAQGHGVPGADAEAPHPVAGGKLLPDAVLGRRVAGLQVLPVAERADAVLPAGVLRAERLCPGEGEGLEGDLRLGPEGRVLLGRKARLLSGGRLREDHPQKEGQCQAGKQDAKIHRKGPLKAISRSTIGRGPPRPSPQPCP